ncbi:MAG: YihY/virulence factor BrkB family protein, partial [Parachlamydia sp.]|nr:YihY/virulence factor BrkB family protein [Parachlamydia sp.]
MPEHLTHAFNSAKRIVTSSLYDFWKDDCYTKSSLLTLYTLQSIVPFVALVLGIARGFGLDEYLLKLVTTLFEGQREVIDYTVKFSYSMLQHLQGQVVAGIGVIFLLWTVLTLLNYIESVLNEIWKVRTSRAFMRKFSDYLALLVVCPIIFVASSSITLYINSQITNYETLLDSAMVKNASSHLQVMMKFISPLLLSWLVFICIYLFVPNTKFSLWPRVVAAVVAGSLFQLWQIFYL